MLVFCLIDKLSDNFQLDTQKDLKRIFHPFHPGDFSNNISKHLHDVYAFILFQVDSYNV